MRLFAFFSAVIRRFFKKADGFEVLIGDGTESRGNIRSTGTVKIKGKHSGDIFAGTIIVLDKAFVKGELKAKAAVIGGTVEGNVTAGESVEIKATGRLTGFVYSKILSVEKCGIFNGYASVHKTSEELPAALPQRI